MTLKVRPDGQPKPQHIVIDLVVAGDEVMSGREVCLSCEAGFEDADVMLRVRDLRLMFDYLIHRRCIEKALASGPVDDEEFLSYRERVLSKYAR